MRKRAAIAVTLLLAALGIVWAQQYPAYTLRYRLTAEVETPDGVKSGSSVIEVTYSWPGRLLDPDSVQWRITGEGVLVDLGDGRNLIVTLTRSSSGREDALDVAWLALKIYDIPWDKQEMPVAIAKA